MVPVQMDADLVQAAQAGGITVHAAIREAIRDWLEGNKKGPAEAGPS